MSAPAAAAPLHIEHVALKLRLEARVTGCARHRVQLFQYATTHESPVQVFDVEIGRDTHVLFACPARDSKRTHLVARWFADRTDDETGTAQEYLAGGIVHAADATARLIDAEKAEQGTLRVVGWASDLRAPIAPPMAVPDKLRRDVRDEYRRLKATDDERFVYVDVLLGDSVRPMPLLWYAVSATQMRATPAQTTELFDWWLLVVERLKPRGVVGARPPADVLADLVALPSLGWVYRPDRTPTGADADCWASLWSHPDVGRAAYDCEDGARACYEMFVALRDTELTAHASPQLRLVQHTARFFTPWLTIGELRQGKHDECVMHCWLVLEARTGKAAVPIVIESTEYASGPWRADATTPAADRARHKLSSHAAKRLGIDDVARVRTPVSMVRERGMYGRVFAQFTASHADGERAHWCVHRVVVEKKKGTIGVPANAFFDPAQRGTASAFTEVTRVRTQWLTQQLASHLAYAPRATFPSPPLKRTLPARRADTRDEILVPQGSDIALTRDMVLGIVAV